ncbi:hypothetical protein [Tsukamurella tyrosinosolvens]|uniref:hypothetical protein n=1 Tax=Tsukamurella tyrosinosolvens TaxID=57704 RepID=UPI000DF6F002|nr:hypothetical protein [Tsukamurella tyrosinosolvens]
MERLPSADDALRALHRDLERLAAQASTSYLMSQPLRIEDHGEWKRAVWYESEELSIITEDGTVAFAAGRRFDHYPDECHITRATARRIAQALLSASAYVADHPPTDGGPN